VKQLPIVFVALIWLSPCDASEDENIAIAKAMVAAINDRDLDALDGLVAPNVVRKSAATAGVTINSLDDFKEFLENDFSAVPDSVMKIDIIFGNDQFVAMRTIYAGTQNGQMGPFPPSGKYFELPFIGILKLENGKISEIWVEWDNVYALSQLGHFDPAEKP
jgi:steroid delta-isomerase-like uncharacterized protein